MEKWWSFKKDGSRQGHQLPQLNLKTPLLSFFEPRSTRNSRWSWLNLVKGGAWKEEFGACLKITDPHWLPRSAFCWWWGGAKPTKCDSFKRPDQQWKKDSPQHQHQPQKQYHHHNQYHTWLNHWIPIEYVQNYFSSLSHSYAFPPIVITFSVLGNTLDTIEKRNPAPASMKPQIQQILKNSPYQLRLASQILVKRLKKNELSKFIHWTPGPICFVVAKSETLP